MPIPRQNKVKRSSMAASYSQVQHGTVSIVRKSELSERQVEGLGLGTLQVGQILGRWQAFEAPGERSSVAER